MNQPKTNFAVAAFFIICLSLNNSFAQTPDNKPIEPSFDIILQTIVASNDASGKTDIAPSLAGIVKKLKADFSFGSYRLSSTSIQRAKNRSGIYSRNVSFTSEKNLAVYSNLGLEFFEVRANEQNQEMFEVLGFKFSQQIPITNAAGAINYEAVNLNGNFSLVRNAPTVIGSLSTLKPDELMFLIMTVKPAEK